MKGWLAGRFWREHLGSSLVSATCWLCDLEQVTEPLWDSEFPFKTEIILMLNLLGLL